MKWPRQGAATTVLDAVAKCLEGRGGEYLHDVQIGGPWTPDEPCALPGWAPWARDEKGEGKFWRLSLEIAGLGDGGA